MEQRDDAVEPVNQNTPGYANEQPRKAGLKSLIPSALVSALVCGVMIFTGVVPQPNLVTKDDFTVNLQAMSKELASVKATSQEAGTKAQNASADILTINKDVASLKASNGSFVAVSNFTALQNEVNALKSNPSTTITAQIKELQDKTATLTANLTASEAKVADLTTRLNNITGATGGTVTGAVTAELTTNGMFPTSFTTTDPTTAIPYQIPLKLKVTNGTNKPINNLQLYISMGGYTGSGAVLNGTASLTSVTGGTSLWSAYSRLGNVSYFTNTNMTSWAGTGLNLTASTYKTFTLIFTFTPTVGQVGTTIQFYPDIAPVSDSDYEVG